MRLIHNMSTIAEYPSAECPSSRVIKIAVVGGSGVGKTGTLRTSFAIEIYSRLDYTSVISTEMVLVCSCFSYLRAALVVRFLTKRFIGDYERNVGEFSRLIN